MGSVNLDKLHKLVPGHAVIRVMPNTPLAVGCGMTAIAPDENVSEEMLDVAKAVFGSCGEIEIYCRKRHRSYCGSKRLRAGDMYL